MARRRSVPDASGRRRTLAVRDLVAEPYDTDARFQRVDHGSGLPGFADAGLLASLRTALRHDRLAVVGNLAASRAGVERPAGEAISVCAAGARRPDRAARAEFGLRQRNVSLFAALHPAPARTSRGRSTSHESAAVYRARGDTLRPRGCAQRDATHARRGGDQLSRLPGSTRALTARSFASQSRRNTKCLDKVKLNSRPAI